MISSPYPDSLVHGTHQDADIIPVWARSFVSEERRLAASIRLSLLGKRPRRTRDDEPSPPGAFPTPTRREDQFKMRHLWTMAYLTGGSSAYELAEKMGLRDWKGRPAEAAVRAFVSHHVEETRSHWYYRWDKQEGRVKKFSPPRRPCPECDALAIRVLKAASEP